MTSTNVYNFLQKLTIGWTLKLPLLGAVSLGKVLLYGSAGVKGEWQAGVDSIMKNGFPSGLCADKNVSAFPFWKKNVSML